MGYGAELTYDGSQGHVIAFAETKEQLEEDIWKEARYYNALEYVVSHIRIWEVCEACGDYGSVLKCRKKRCRHLLPVCYKKCKKC